MPGLSAPDLTVPASTDTLRRILSASLRRLLSDLRGLPLEPRVLDRLRSLLRSSPGQVFTALRRPTVGVLIRCSRGPGGPQPQLSQILGAELGLPSPGTPCLGLRRPRRSFLRIERELMLATVDVNPLAMQEAHPDKSGNAVDLGERSAGEWCSSLREALRIVERDLPVVREEIDLLIQQIVPVGWHAESHLSASYAEAVGTIYLTLHPNPMTMAEALVHEHQHNKLNALLDLDPILENSFDERYASPVRPDPRPLFGVLLAVHAFLPIEQLYRRRIDAGEPRLSERYEQIVRVNRDAAQVVCQYARPTETGRQLIDEIARLSGR